MRLYFSGVVLPERAQFGINNINISVSNADGRRYMDVVLNIFNNQVSAAVDTDDRDIDTTRNIVRNQVELVTSVAGFLLGRAYDIDIVKVFDPELKETRVFGIDIPVLANRNKDRPFDICANALVTLCFGPEGRYFRRCLADLSLAIKHADDTAFYCYRALESLRHSFGSQLNEKEQWKALAAAVASSRDDMGKLRDQAFPARHGEVRSVTDDDRQKHFLYTWEKIEKYVDFRLVEKGMPPVFSGAIYPDPGQ